AASPVGQTVVQKAWVEEQIHKAQTATPTRGAEDARRWAGFLPVMRLSHCLFLQQQTPAFREGRLRGQRFYKRRPASVSKMSNRANILAYLVRL
ncbi:MAG: hypothetical protein ACPIOQ_23625, partial [Promethearchaeia archaeon]